MANRVGLVVLSFVFVFVFLLWYMILRITYVMHDKIEDKTIRRHTKISDKN